MLKTYPATLDSLATIAEDAEIFCEENGIDGATTFALNLCLDELFTNSATYGYNLDPTKSVEISLEIQNGYLIAQIVDRARAFNPLGDIAAAVTEGSAESRPIGGLGVFLVKKNMDEVSYSRIDGKNIISMRRKIAGKDIEK